MSKLTQRDIIKAALIARGSIIEASRTTHKTLVMTVPGEANNYYYLGKAGSLRKGPTKTASMTQDRLKLSLLGVKSISFEVTG